MISTLHTFCKVKEASDVFLSPFAAAVRCSTPTQVGIHIIALLVLRSGRLFGFSRT